MYYRVQATLRQRIVGWLIFFAFILLLFLVFKVNWAATYDLNPSMEEICGAGPCYWERLNMNATANFSMTNDSFAGENAVKVEVSGNQSGQYNYAGWVQEASFQRGRTYTVTVHYKSNVSSDLLVRRYLDGGGQEIIILATIPPAAEYTAYSTGFNAECDDYYLGHAISQEGWLIDDSFDVEETTLSRLNRFWEGTIWHSIFQWILSKLT